MKKIRNKNKIILFILVLIIGIGYAYISTNLSILTNLAFRTNNWNIYFDNIIEKNGSEFVTTHPETSGTNTTDISFTVNLPKPGDYYEFYVDIVNDSDIDAMVSLVTKNNLTSSQQQYAEFLITYFDDAEIQENNLLEKGITDKLKVLVRYKTDITKEILESEKEPINISLELEYTSADKNAKKRDRNYVEIIDGSDLKVKMKELANGSPIQHFRRVYEISSSNKIDDNKISTGTSNKDVYAWYDSGYINVYSDTFDDIYFTNLAYMFQYYTDLIDIDLKGFATDKVENMTFMFEGATSLEKILNDSSLNYENLEDAYGAFKDCTSLKYITITLKSNKLTDLSSMFYGCTALKTVSLIVPIELIENMDSMFMNCTSLVNVSFRDQKNEDTVTKNLKSVESMFENCTQLETIGLYRFDFTNLEYIYKMFYGCSRLEQIVINPSMDVNIQKAVTVFQTGYDIFTGCTSLSGGNGTIYDENHTNSDYFTVDGMRFDKTTNSWVADNTVKGYLRTELEID